MKQLSPFKSSDLLELITEVQYFESQENYTLLHFADDKKQLFSSTLKHYETQLTNQRVFSRIHRRYLVNREFIASHNKCEVLLSCGKRLSLARRRRV